MPKLALLLPQLAQDLAEGLRETGHEALAATMCDVEVVRRCSCSEPGCVTFYAVDETEAPIGPACERIIAPASGVNCVQHHRGRIVWVEALGRPNDRRTLDELLPLPAGSA